MSSWYGRDVDTTLEDLRVDSDVGLDDVEVERRRARFGPNELVERHGRSPWRILREQFTAAMVLILLAAAGVSALVGDFKNTVAILAIVVLFAALGFFQEYRAERAMAALKRLTLPIVRVRRGGVVRDVAASALVPGDVVLLEAGNAVPADCRVITSANLRVQESALTGESEPVDKDVGAIEGVDVPIGDRRNLVYMGTTVVHGRGVAVVVETGMRTELGQIARMIQSAGDDHTPLQRRLDRLGKVIGLIAVAVAVLIFALGLLKGEPLSLMLMTAVSVAVAAVPEGLPAVVTITLAIGAQRMLRRHALIRKLPAVETLGSVTVICSDKTGTLTENRMSVTVLEVAGHQFDVRRDRPVQVPPGSAAELVLVGGVLCNDAVLQPADDGTHATIGDPTETSIVDAAAAAGLLKTDLDAAFPRLAEAPFESGRKRMATVHRLDGSAAGVPASVRAILPSLPSALPAAAEPRLAICFVKGAVDSLVLVSTSYLSEGRVLPLDDRARERIVSATNVHAADGMRVLGVGFRFVDPHGIDTTPERLERELVFVGFVGIIDPPRAEARDAVATCRAAGIRPIMITGDHPLTANAIARDLGIHDGGRVVTGRELATMSDERLLEAVDEASVFARVSPEHKFRIVEALQKRGNVVAMTGDGVNDAPALKRADIGVAMGITGTDVAKEASEMVLRDDNFATIVAAVEEGRVIFDNIRRFIAFSIAGNVGKILVALVGPLAGTPLPLLPLQLLWLNLLTDGLLGLGLGVEKAERNVMQRPPQSPQAPIISAAMWRTIGSLGLLIGGLSFGLGFWYWSTGNAAWQTVIFTSLAFAQVGQSLAIRSASDPLVAIGLGSNRPLLGLVVAVVVLQLVVVTWAPVQPLFGTVPLSWLDLGLCAGVGVAVFAVLEAIKLFGRR